ncbi:histone deacetylase family protein [Lacimicrobium alkaliphilum]|uniref:Deacetylase n=1 Tax=Lacimicrobium alkaliphilum TaxID=1526571 RepID=A0ABQ1RFE3_9ALTE|nr:histone deacetylase family protein [Lacimicrobium alkaliphilum]GGD68725.1 deacetylase [Lacimicrobium alkaliphilum]
MSLLFISHPKCSEHDVGNEHPECPERLDAINDRLIASGMEFSVVRQQAIAADRTQLYRAHSPEYVDRVFALSPESGQVQMDPDTQMMPHSLEAALYAAGANIQAVDAVLSGEMSQAFCAVRPPGHHAERDKAMGFCLFNNIAVGAMHALHQYGLKRIAIVDFDVHHGNGTENIFFNDQRVLFCSSYEYPFYPYNVGPGNEHILNLPLPAGTDSEAFQQAIQDRWLDKLDAFAPELIMISAGFDAHFEDDMAHFKLVETDYHWITSQLKALANKHCQGRMVSTLEGGYALSALGRSVIVHLKAMLD